MRRKASKVKNHLCDALWEVMAEASLGHGLAELTIGVKRSAIYQ